MNTQPVHPKTAPNDPQQTRRRLLGGGLGLLLADGLALAGCSTSGLSPDGAPGLPGPVTLSAKGVILPRVRILPPIVFVHGNGDSAAIWQTLIWRFESNGWPRPLLHAVNFDLPTARNDDRVPQTGRSGSADQLRDLADNVARVCHAQGADKVVLVGNSRGGYAIRNFIRGEGRGKVIAAILGGVPNHGVWRGGFNPGSEFNGSGLFLSGLNAPQGADGLEVTAGVPVLTLRSDNNDKYAQPLGTWLGQPKMETGITYEGPALKGARNLILPGKDHRELSFHRDAFAETFMFLTGEAPARLDVLPEDKPILNGMIAGQAVAGASAAETTNLPMPGVRVTVFEVDPASGARRGEAVHQKTTGADGRWGPFVTRSDARHEFVIEAPDYAITHHYRMPFPRSSDIVHLRPATHCSAGQGRLLGDQPQPGARLLRRRTGQDVLRRPVTASWRAGGGGGRGQLENQDRRCTRACSDRRIQSGASGHAQLACFRQPPCVWRIHGLSHPGQARRFALADKIVFVSAFR